MFKSIKNLNVMIFVLTLANVDIQAMPASHQRFLDNINARDSNGMTMLSYAVAKGNKLMAQWFLDHGANPNMPNGQYQQTALHIAANLESGSFEGSIALLLLRYGANPNVFDRVVTSRKILSRTPAGLAKSYDIKRGILAYPSPVHVVLVSDTGNASDDLPVAYPVQLYER